VSNEITDYLPSVILAAQKAGEALLSHFHSGLKHSITMKPDQSPVTQADIAANKIIIDHLIKIDPKIPLLSEENGIPDFSIRKTWSRYWLIDPLDGTRGFIKHSPEFCVNIALIENHMPILGVIYSPVDQYCYYATKNKGAFYQSKEMEAPAAMHTCKAAMTPLRFLTGRFDQHPSFKKVIEKHFKEVTITQMNSALKFPQIARGIADVYVRLGSTSEWDTAAGHCIVNEAGGSVVDFSGRPLHYNTQSSLINPPFIAMGDPAQCDKYIAAVSTQETL